MTYPPKKSHEDKQLNSEFQPMCFVTMYEGYLCVSKMSVPTFSKLNSGKDLAES